MKELQKLTQGEDDFLDDLIPFQWNTVGRGKGDQQVAVHSRKVHLCLVGSLEVTYLNQVCDSAQQGNQEYAHSIQGVCAYQDPPGRHCLLFQVDNCVQESLGGNTKTTLMITVSPALYNSDETLSTLRFGAR